MEKRFWPARHTGENAGGVISGRGATEGATGVDSWARAVLGTITSQTGLDTIVRGTEGTLSYNDGGFLIEPAPGSTRRRASVSLAIQERDHMRDFLQCIHTREKPNCDIELAYRVQVSLIMAMMSFTEGKVAHFDAATETIRMS